MPLTHDQIDAAVAKAKTQATEVESKLTTVAGPEPPPELAELETALAELLATVEHLAELAHQGAVSATSTSTSTSEAAAPAAAAASGPEPGTPAHASQSSEDLQAAAPAQTDAEVKAAAAEGSPVATGESPDQAAGGAA